MSFRDCLVIERADDWCIVVGSATERLPVDVSAQELANGVARLVESAGLRNPACVLAPASTSCFFATLDVDPQLDARDRAALTYELEDHLPIDAESMAADFVRLADGGDRGQRVAAVAVRLDRWTEIIDALESNSVMVRSIVPSAVLAIRSILHHAKPQSPTRIMLVDDGHCDLIHLADDAIAGWKYAGVDANALRRQVVLDRQAGDQVIVVGARQDQLPIIQNVYEDVTVAADSLVSHQLHGATLTLTAPSTRWFDLRRDRLAPSDPLRPILGPLRLLAFAAAVLLLAVVLGAWWREQRIRTEIASLRVQQEQLFRQVFPDARVPVALLRRVRSEHAKVLGSRGASPDIDVPQSAGEVLRALLAALPETIRFRISRIDIANGKVDLDLQVRSPVDAGSLATSLSLNGFDVQPPVTNQKDAKTFESLLEAEWKGDANTPSDRDGVSIRLMFIEGEIG